MTYVRTYRKPKNYMPLASSDAGGITNLKDICNKFCLVLSGLTECDLSFAILLSNVIGLSFAVNYQVV